MEQIELGHSGVRVAPLAVGCWAWGDARYWGYGKRVQPGDVVDAFRASLDAGVDFFDTAEVYGHGESEKILGYMLRRAGVKAAVATKFAPLPGRGGLKSLRRALEASLKRLGRDSVELYQVHWCDTAVASIDALMDELVIAQKQGLIKALGVSNFTATETVTAQRALEHRGATLASNQVHYSLLWRAPEADGVLDACRERGITVLAYSPLAQGLLAGRYLDTPVPEGPRAQSAIFLPERVDAARSVVPVLRALGEAHGGKSAAQVALRWLAQQPGVVPIAGASAGAQASENAGALGWSLSEAECAQLAVATAAWVRVE